MAKISKLPPGIVYTLNKKDKKWVTVGKDQCRTLNKSCQGDRIMDPYEIVGRLPPDQLDAAEWKEEYRLPEGYDPEKHELWWVTHKKNRWVKSWPGVLAECPTWKRVEPVRAASPKAHPGDQIEELKKKISKLEKSLTEVTEKALRAAQIPETAIGMNCIHHLGFGEGSVLNGVGAFTIIEATEDGDYLIAGKHRIDSPAAWAAMKRGKSMDLEPVRDPIDNRPYPAGDPKFFKAWADKINGKKSSRLPEIAKWIATIGALGAGIWSIV